MDLAYLHGPQKLSLNTQSVSFYLNPINPLSAVSFIMESRKEVEGLDSQDLEIEEVSVLLSGLPPPHPSPGKTISVPCPKDELKGLSSGVEISCGLSSEAKNLLPSPKPHHNPS